MRLTAMRFALPLLLLAAAAGRAGAQGGPPLVTDDPGTPGPGHWEVNFAVTYEGTDHERPYELPLLDVNYGWGERVQLKFEVPYVVVDEEGNDPTSGLGNVLLGAKWRLLDEDEQGIAASVYPQVELNASGASARRGVVEEGTTVLVPIELGRSFGRLDAAAEVGYQFVQYQEDQWVAGLAASYHLSKRLELAAELRAVSDQDFQQNDVFFNVGARWEFAEGRMLLASLGRSLRDLPDSANLMVYLGVRFNF
jgi:hypothetical protein